MSRRVEGDEGKKAALNMRVTNDLRARLEAAAEASGRSLAQEAEFRLESLFDPVNERLLNISTHQAKSSLVVRALVSVFASVDFDKDGVPSYLSRAGLAAAFNVILEEHFPQPGGLLADLFSPEDKAAKAKVEERMAKIAEGIVAGQRAALYGDPPPNPGLSLLQTAMVLGLIPSDHDEAAKSLAAAAEAAKPKRGHKVEKSRN